MGKGIALQFKLEWPAMFRDYEAAVRSRELRPGRVHVWRTGRDRSPRFIFNFPTKFDWRSASRLEYIDSGLADLVSKVRTLGVTSISIPALGAGNGGLDWSLVRPKIESAFSGLPEVDVQIWEPQHPFRGLK